MNISSMLCKNFNFISCYFALLRKDRITSKLAANSFPHYLDAKCNPSKDDLYLPEDWYLENYELEDE